jgi:hypothetical protein
MNKLTYSEEPYDPDEHQDSEEPYDPDEHQDSEEPYDPDGLKRMEIIHDIKNILDDKKEYVNYLNIKEDKSLSKFISQIMMNLIKLHKKKTDSYDIMNSEHSSRTRDMKYFIGDTMPDTSVYDYIYRCVKYFKCGYACHVYAIIYIDKLLEYNSNLFICNYNYHKIYGIALLCACKFMEDEICTNKYYSKVLGLSIDEINIFEKLFLIYIDYKLYVSINTYTEYEKSFLLIQH